MRKKKSLLLLFGIIPVILIVLIIMRFVNANRIAHFKQYMFPCKGQVVFYKSPNEEESEAFIPFYFFDEEEISEMASKENIKQVSVITSEGERLSCELLNLTGETNPYNSHLQYKELDVQVKVSKECVLSKLEIQYVDKTERFEIGDLKLVMLTDEGDELENIMFVQSNMITSDLVSFDTKTHPQNGISMFSPTSFMISTWLEDRDVHITGIKTGLDEFHLDFSNTKKIPNSADGSVADLKKMDNHPIYGKNIIYEGNIEEHGDIICKYTDGTEYDDYIISLQKEESYGESIYNIYLNPLIYITDDEGREYTYADIGQPFVYEPQYFGEEGNKLMEELLRKEGK